jgi:DNA-binding response OmpR family regulator
METATILRASPRSDVTASRASPLRVLVVADDAGTARLLTSLLQLAGHDVRIAKDKLNAFALFKVFTPDVVVFDIRFPRKEVCESSIQLKAAEDGENLFIIAITGAGEASDWRHSFEAGIDLHLVKPVNPDLLLRVLMRFREVAK